MQENPIYYPKKAELEERTLKLRNRLSVLDPQWSLALIISKVNQYYFTGTMQDAVYAIPRDKEATLFVRRSYERACDESPLDKIVPIPKGYRDMAEALGEKVCSSQTVYLEEEIVPVAMVYRLHHHMNFGCTKALDSIVGELRSIKSPSELLCMQKSGVLHAHIMNKVVPKLLREGISEAQLATELYAAMMQNGHHGTFRLRMFDTNITPGHICFGENSLYPTSFNGPGGHRGLSPAVPSWGSETRFLRKGDLVFIDIAFGVAGYHTDKTMLYCFGENILTGEALAAHQQCVAIEKQTARMLVPGAIPSQIYQQVMSEQTPEFLKDFMGYGNRTVPFLGHSLGLQGDETPIIAKKFDKPVEENMVFAIEPKKGIKGIGMVGTENTYHVTPNGGHCLTDDSVDMITVE